MVPASSSWCGASLSAASVSNRSPCTSNEPARLYVPELLPDVLDGHIVPGRVFDFETELDGVATAHAAMDERRAIRSLVRVGSL
jgi:hypothetical protein